VTTSTTLKLPDELRERIAPLAQSAGKTPHAWMIEALEAQAELAELRRSFLDDALRSAADIDAGGPLYAMEDMHAYIAERAAGRKAAHPKPLVAESRPSRASTRRRR
jgi:predicted transcriptional regulator